MDENRVARLLGGLFIALRYGLTDDGRRVVVPASQQCDCSTGRGPE
jgi:hypothetical protein